MNQSILAALQLYQFGLTPIPLKEKRPILKNWASRFTESPIQQNEIINGLINPDGEIIRFESSNIEIITGSVSNCIVLDIDDLSLLSRLRKMEPIPDTWTVRSNRGIHLYFNYNNKIPSMKLWGNIDVLSDKIQVVAPPSIHPNGIVYKWLLSPKVIEKADLPKWLLEYLIDYSNPKKLLPSNKKTQLNRSYNRL